VKGSPQSFKHRRFNPAVPQELDVCLFLPGVGSVLDYEWTEPAVRARATLAAQQEAESLLTDTALANWRELAKGALSE
jgi:hypothetical protein